MDLMRVSPVADDVSRSKVLVVNGITREKIPIVIHGDVGHVNVERNTDPGIGELQIVGVVEGRELALGLE